MGARPCSSPQRLCRLCVYNVWVQTGQSLSLELSITIPLLHLLLNVGGGWRFRTDFWGGWTDTVLVPSRQELRLACVKDSEQNSRLSRVQS